ncbi:MAG: HlyC/CorC family transporter [Opitutales bacterium]|nr:HlyC/CorC family transporter [Opitutales bacterium]MCH8541622.1 hemolysin family protein [Opitutales bacterium]
MSEFWELYREVLIWIGCGLLAIVFHFLFVLADCSLIKLQFTRFASTAITQFKQRPKIAAMLFHSGEISRVIRMGCLASSVALGLFFFLALEAFFQGPGSSITPMWRAVAYPVAFLLVILFHTLFGDLLPRSMGIQNPCKSLRWSGWWIGLTRFLAKPLELILLGLLQRVLPLMGLRPSPEAERLDAEVQIANLLQEGEEISPLTEKILTNALQLRKLVVQDVLLPRNQIQYFDLTRPVEENLEIARKTGHTRFPLCEGELDQTIGLIHIKDIFRARTDLKTLDLRKIKRPVVTFGPDDTLDFVLQRLLKQKLHMALVSDEFGGIIGGITLENILEELVGDIQDEFDREEEQIRPTGQEGVFLIDGLTPIHEVAETLQVSLSDEEVSTFGGLIISTLGRLPRKGEECHLGPLRIKVEEADERRLSLLQVTLEDPSSDGE